MKKYSILAILAMAVTSLTSCNEGISDDVSFIEYSGLIVSESAANDGTFSATIDIEVINDTFREDLEEDEDYKISNLTPGLTATFSRVDDNNATLSISGSTPDHVRCAFDTAGLNIYRSAVSSGSRPLNAAVNLFISFTGATYTLSGTTFTEANPNSGSFAGVATMTISGGAGFTVPNLAEEVHYKLSEELPEGLSLDAAVTSSTTLEIGVEGAAANNASADSVQTVLTFLETDLTGDTPTISPFSANAFCNNASVAIPLSFLFQDCATLTITPNELQEDAGGGGGIPGSATLTLAGGSFDTMVDAGDFNFSGVPGGLTPVVTASGGQTATLTFMGNAAPNDSAVSGDVTITGLNAGLASSGQYCQDAELNSTTLTLTFED